MTTRAPLLFPTVLLLAGCAATSSSTPPIEPALDTLSSDDLMRHIEALSSDEYEGRGPGTEGGRKTVEYLVREFQASGLKPGNPDGTYVQRVPLMGYETTSTASFTSLAGEMKLEHGTDFVAVTRLESVDLKHLDVVFCGYGTVAPEYSWDDFGDTDVTGKVVVMLVNDPPIPDPDDPTRLDDSMFRGEAMTYYGRWTYKNEIAHEKGAAAVVLVHETGPAGYPWEVVSGSWGREGFDIAGPDAAGSHVPVEAWVQRDVAAKLFEDCGMDFAQMKLAALSPDFQPVALPGVSADFELSAAIRQIESNNVVALLEGSDPDKRDELIVFTAHWDHLGIDPSREGDQIFNGAIDNASGTAALLELAGAMAALDPPPDRSMLFLAVTAEEKGLLGSKYYASKPLYPLSKTVANVNMDGLNCYGRTSDVVSIGFGLSTLDEILTKESAAQGRTVKPDAEPEKGFYFRSDHFSFAKLGVPALYAESGVDYVGRPSGWGQARRDRYTASDYHKVSDEIQDDWNLAGGLEDVALYLRVGLNISQAAGIPEWKSGAEFKAVREASLRSAP